MSKRQKCAMLDCQRRKAVSIIVDTYNAERERWYSHRCKVCRICEAAYVEGINRGLHIAAAWVK